MKGRCGECERRWFCDEDSETCGAFPDPVVLEFDSKDDMIAQMLDDLETIMQAGGRNVDTCNFCSFMGCYNRGGSQCCAPVWHGKMKEPQ